MYAFLQTIINFLTKSCIVSSRIENSTILVGGAFFFEFPDKDENGNKQTVNSPNFMTALRRNKRFFNFLKRHQGASVIMDGDRCMSISG